ncbi:Cytochrome P450 9e2 [Orchesella cincta]|uniref:Cytochrome P450 9e2 n=1 Tax=Orchesella cincta TaxID=48709 RepID=A0A1D2MDW0_ORCCI|nr:Cytochrome P450 9e2 [Orchesella cincta]
MGLVVIILLLIPLGILGIMFYFMYQTWKHGKNFEKQNIPYLGAGWYRLVNFMRGKISLPEAEALIYQEALATRKPFVGFYDLTTAKYYITDLDLMRHIYVKDFDHFQDRRPFAALKSDILFKKMLLSLEGARSNGGDYDICEAYPKYAIDVIASSACGVESKAFEFTETNGPLSEFERMAAKFQLKFSFTMFLKFMVITMLPKVADFFGFEAMDLEPQIRKTGERHDDFLQLMMDTQQGLLKAEENDEENTKNLNELTDEDIVANAVMFLNAGFDTSQSVLIFAAYALAKEQDVQERLYKEVKSIMDANGGNLTYDGVLEMNYLDMFVNETLRMFPPAAKTVRSCVKDYQIPGTQTVIKKGSIVTMPVYGIHSDSKYYENPEKFNPENFLPEKKAQRYPVAFASFGHGPRSCIGSRFALFKVKVAIAALVYNFKLQPSARTQIPVKFGNAATLKPLNGMVLYITPR